MALSDLLLEFGTKAPKVQDIDRARVDEHVDDYRSLVAYWRLYPDRFIDYLCSLNPDNKFRLYFVQRVFLRICMRYKTVYAVFSRGFSKSFLAVMVLMLKAILYPRSQLAVSTYGKQQSASIVTDKMELICEMIPAIANEIMWDTRGQIMQTSRSKDSVSLAFKNGSKLSNAAMSEQTRGKRFQSLLIEESAKVDQEKLTEIIMPTLVVSREIPGWGSDPDEVLNQSAIFVTSAGYKNTFAYDKLIDTLCHMVADRGNSDAFVFGGDWKIPVVEGLQPADFIQSQEADASMDEAGFDREYNSKWAGSASGCFFNANKIDQHRVLNMAEDKFNKTLPPDGYYVMGVDVGRFGDMTECVIIKVVPTSENRVPKKHVVNIYTFEAEHFEKQAIEIKRLFKRFKCDMCVLDGNGVGAGLVDFLVRDQIDPDTDEPLYNWGVYNDDERKYRDWETSATVHNALYIMKANAPLNSEMYSYCQGQLNAGKLKFLVDETIAKSKLLASGKKMNAVQRAEYLRPFSETSILKSQMLNLVQSGEGANITLKKVAEKIKKDKFSALIYGLYWCKIKEDKGHRRKNRDLSKMTLFTKH